MTVFDTKGHKYIGKGGSTSSAFVFHLDLYCFERAWAGIQDSRVLQRRNEAAMKIELE